MQITINDPILSTEIFIAIFVFILLLSIRRKKNPDLFPLELTQELKGLAILAVIFSHIGYFLTTGHRFLFPLSIMGGVGVNLFLFLSGYGLTISALNKELSAIQFYKRRLLKLFRPLWLVVLGLLLLDYFLLHISYSGSYIIQSLLGLFPRADLFLDLDSPLWFFTPILFYCLIFPLVFLKKQPWLSAIIIYVASYLVLLLKLPVSVDVLHLYQLHLLAFPLGIAFASLNFQPYYFSRIVPAKIKAYLSDIQHPVFIKKILDRFKMPAVLASKVKIINLPLYYLISIFLIIIIGFTAYYSGVGMGPDTEQTISLVTAGALIFLFMRKKFEIKALYIFGIYAYEIYLIHWPLMSRHDIFFKYLPGWLAMLLYLSLFLIIAWAMQKLLISLKGQKSKIEF